MCSLKNISIREKRIKLMLDLEVKLKENGWQIPSFTAISADRRMASSGTYKRYFGSIEEAVEMLARYKYGQVTDEELDAQPLEAKVFSKSVTAAKEPFYAPMPGVLSDLDTALRELRKIYSNEVLESIHFAMSGTMVFYIGREYYCSIDNANKLTEMTRLAEKAKSATGGRERMQMSRMIRDTGWQMQHPGPLYPCDP